jgi:hypothetical protein
MVRTSSALIVALMSVSWTSALAQTQGQPATPAGATQPTPQTLRKGYWVQTNNGWRVAKAPTIDIEELAATPRPEAVRPGQPAPARVLTTKPIEPNRAPATAPMTIEASTQTDAVNGFEIKPIEAAPAPAREPIAPRPASSVSERIASEFESRPASELIKPAPSAPTASAQTPSRDESLYERPAPVNEPSPQAKVETPTPAPVTVAVVSEPAPEIKPASSEPAPQTEVATLRHEVIMPQGPMIPVPPMINAPATTITHAEPVPAQPAPVAEPAMPAPSEPAKVATATPVPVAQPEPTPAPAAAPTTVVTTTPESAPMATPSEPVASSTPAMPNPVSAATSAPEPTPQHVTVTKVVEAPAPSEVKVEPKVEAKPEAIVTAPVTSEPKVETKIETKAEPKPEAPVETAAASTTTPSAPTMPSMVTSVPVVTPEPPAQAKLDAKPAETKANTTKPAPTAVAKAEPAKPAAPSMDSKALRNQLKSEPVTVRVTAADGPEGQIQGRIIDNGTALDWTNLGTGLEGSGVIELRTGAAGELQLVMDEQATVQIGAMSTATLKKAKLSDGTTRLFVELRRGKATVTPIKAGASVSVLTPTELVAIKERTEVRFDAAFGTRVQTLEVATPQNTTTTP